MFVDHFPQTLYPLDIIHSEVTPQSFAERSDQTLFFINPQGPGMNPKHLRGNTYCEYRFCFINHFNPRVLNL